MTKKSAKDLAFEKERNKLKHKIRELKYELEQKEKTISLMSSEISSLNSKIEEYEDWIRRLLEFTEMNESDMKSLIQKEKDKADMINHMSDLLSFFNLF